MSNLIFTGQWIDRMSGIGAGSDSFFEYLLKSYILFNDDEYLHMYHVAMSAVSRHIRSNWSGVYLNVHMSTKQVMNRWIDSLQAFMPAMLVLSGSVDEAIRMHNVYQKIWEKYSALPERFNVISKHPEIPVYPLRPELIESTYYLYRATRDPRYLRFGKRVMDDINKYMRVDCGFATLHSVFDKSKEDRMESFFLSEVCKYLYLLFDEANPLHHDGTKSYVLSTQGHVLHIPTHVRDTFTDEFRTSLFDEGQDNACIHPSKKTCRRIPWQFYMMQHKHAEQNATAHEIVYGKAAGLIEHQPNIVAKVMNAVRDVFKGN